MTSDPIVYSTDGGRLNRCPTCGKKYDACRCNRKPAAKPNAPPSDGVVRVSRDARQRRGKTVTLITGVRGDEATLQELAGALKRLCGAGGAVKDGVIAVQGDHREQIVARLRELGYTVKVAGG